MEFPSGTIAHHIQMQCKFLFLQGFFPNSQTQKTKQNKFKAKTNYTKGFDSRLEHQHFTN